VDAQILHLLMDGETHTQTAIAIKIEVDRKTVFNGIERLRVVFIIHTFKGGRTGGGVYLDPRHVYYGLKKKPA
jgi:DNA-binding Lrp family transcriptional regulator